MYKAFKSLLNVITIIESEIMDTSITHLTLNAESLEKRVFLM